MRVLPIPVDAPAGRTVQDNRASGGEIVLGYAGRVVREHKRLDRLPEFLRALDGAGVKFRFEVLGEGPLRPELERACGGRVKFHGWTTKKEFWRVLATWDGAVFFSEVEGGPHALLESMALGGIPFFPRIGGSLGDIYARQVDARCHYPAGDLAALSEGVREIFSRGPAQREALRAKARAAVAAHTWEKYRATLTGFLTEILTQPRISRPGDGARGSWSDALPLGLVTRVARGLLRRS
jgi:glycosyltransferase involved in cell wall biosynthesis